MAIFQSTRPTLGLGISESVASTAPDTFSMFVPGPVPVAPHLLAVGNQQLPYNRTEAFSEVTHDIHRGLQHLFRTDGSIAQLTAADLGRSTGAP